MVDSNTEACSLVGVSVTREGLRSSRQLTARAEALPDGPILADVSLNVQRGEVLAIIRSW